jgi:hypothetical protein
MSSKVLIGNLPPDTTADEVVALFCAENARVEVLKLSDDGNPEQITATVALDVPLATAKVMADRARLAHFKGRELDVYVPQFFS